MTMPVIRFLIFVFVMNPAPQDHGGLRKNMLRQWDAQVYQQQAPAERDKGKERRGANTAALRGQMHFQADGTWIFSPADGARGKKKSYWALLNHSWLLLPDRSMKSMRRARLYFVEDMKKARALEKKLRREYSSLYLLSPSQ